LLAIAGLAATQARAQTAPATHAAQAGRAPTAPADTVAPAATAAGPAPASAAATPPPVPVKTEVGRIDGASFRIDVPRDWNHGLVLYFHGYQPTPQIFDAKYPPTRILEEILRRGYAVAGISARNTGSRARPFSLATRWADC